MQRTLELVMKSRKDHEMSSSFQHRIRRGHSRSFRQPQANQPLLRLGPEQSFEPQSKPKSNRQKSTFSQELKLKVVARHKSISRGNKLQVQSASKPEAGMESSQLRAAAKSKSRRARAGGSCIVSPSISPSKPIEADGTESLHRRKGSFELALESRSFRLAQPQSSLLQSKGTN